MKNKKNKKIRLLALFSTLLATGAILFIGPAHAHAALKIEPIYSVLGDTTQGTGAQVKAIWKQLIDIVNYFIIAILIFVAIAQILRLNVSTYGIKKILPALILAIIGANFSFLFCRLLVDLANIVMSLFINGPQDDNLYTIFRGIGWAEPTHFGLKTASIGMLLWFMIAQLFVIAGGVITLLLAYLFFIRIWLIYFLVALAPLAFMATVLPQTKTVFTQWMSNFAKWVFLPVVSIFWIWLGNQWIGNVKEDYMMSFVFAGVCYYLAITTPFKMGGAVMSAWGNLGKKLVGKPTGWAWGKLREKSIDPWIKYQKDRMSRFLIRQGSGNPNTLINPIGAWVRRGERTRAWREKVAEGVETAKDQLYREAHGGKRWKDEKTGEWHFKYGDKYWKNMARLRDSVSADSGEKDWAEKNMDMMFRQTEEGKQSTRRMLQYKLRVMATDNMLKTIDNNIMVEAMSKNENNPYRNDTSFGVVKGEHHFENQREFYMMSKQALAESELASKKKENDKSNYDFETASSLHMQRVRIEDHEREVEAFNTNPDEWLDKNYKEAGYTEEQFLSLTDKDREDLIGVHRAELADQGEFLQDFWKRGLEELKKDKVLFDQKTQRFTNDAILVKQMVSNEAGTHFETDIKKMKTLAEVFGVDNVNDEMKAIFDSRIRKQLSIIVKNEDTTEASKRSPFESLVRGDKKFHDKMMQVFGGYLTLRDNDAKDTLAAVKNGLSMNVLQEETHDASVLAVKSLISSFKEAKSVDQQKSSLSNIAEIFGRSFKAGLLQERNLKAAMREVAKADIEAAKTAKGIKPEGNLSEEDENRIMSALLTNGDKRKLVEKKLVTKLSGVSNMSEDELEKIVRPELDEHGMLKVKFDMTGDDATKIAKVEKLQNIGETFSYFDARDRTDGKSSYYSSLWGAFKEVIAAVRKEAGTDLVDTLEKAGSKQSRSDLLIL